MLCCERRMGVSGNVLYMLVHLRMLGDLLVLRVQIIVRVVLQKCMGCLERRFELMVWDCWCLWM